MPNHLHNTTPIVFLPSLECHNYQCIKYFLLALVLFRKELHCPFVSMHMAGLGDSILLHAYMTLNFIPC